MKTNFLNEKYKYSRNRLGEVQALGACQLVQITSNLFRKSGDGTIQRRLLTLEHLVSTLSMFDAENPLDTIYAMVAIAKDLKTVAQKESSVHLDALPVTTPRFVESDEPTRKKRSLESDDEATSKKQRRS